MLDSKSLQTTKKERSDVAVRTKSRACNMKTHQLILKKISAEGIEKGDKAFQEIIFF